MSKKPQIGELVTVFDGPVLELSNELSRRMVGIAAAWKIPPFQVLVAFANASAFFLRDQADMDRAHAMERIESLARAMKQTYDICDVKGEG